MQNNFGLNFKTNLNKINGDFRKFQSNTSKVNMKFANMTKDANRASTSIKKLSGSFSGLNTVIKGVSFVAIGRGLGTLINSSLDMIETTHLFNVAMGDMALETGKFVDNVSDVAGLDITNIQNAIGTFSLLSRSMGMSSEQSKVLSTNTYQLGLDLASLTNVPVNQAMQDLRSGLVGQSETMYKYGVDVTEATLKQEAFRQGITKSVRNMSQGEKMALRYAVMIRQTSLTHGDFAETINEPANQLKILAERMTTLGRTIGSVFVPMLQVVLPYLNALLTVLTKIIASIATLFGYESPKIENGLGGFSGIEDGADNATDAIDGTSKAMKKLNNLLGVDELNVLSKPTEPSSTGNGVGVGDLSQFDISGYDAMFSTIKQKSEELIAELMPKVEGLLKIIGLIGAGLLGWKIANSVIDFLTNPAIGTGLLDTLNKIKTSIMGGQGINGLFLAWAGTIAIMIARFADLLTSSENFRKGLVAIGEFGKKAFDVIGIGVGMVLDALKSVGKTIIGLVPESWQKSIKTFFEGFSKFVDALDLDFIDLAITLGGIALLFTPFGAFGKALLIFEALTIAVRAIGYGASDAIDELDLFSDGISDATEAKIKPFIEEMNNLDIKLKEISWGELTIDDAILDDIKTKLSSITEMIVNELDADKNEALQKLEPLRDALGDEAYNKLKLANESYYEEMKTKVATGEDEILKIIESAQQDGGILTQEHYDAIELIRQDMNSLGLKHLSETEVEYNKIMNKLKDGSTRISLEQSRDIIQNAIKTRESTIDDAETQYSTILLEAQRMHDVGKLTDEEYEAIKKSAEDAKDKTIKDANEQFTTIHDTTMEKLGATAKYIDEETGEIKSKWEVWSNDLKVNLSENLDKMKEGIRTWCSDTQDKIDEFKENVGKAWTELWSSVDKYLDEKITKIKKDINDWTDKMQTRIDDFKRDFTKTWESLWGGVKTFFDDVWGSFEEMVRKVVNGIIGHINRMIDAWNDISFEVPTIDIPFIGEIGGGRIGTPKVPRIPKLARGASLERGQIFEAGEFGKAELIGGYQGKTTVMPLENTSFVSAIKTAVMEGVSSASGGGGNIPLIINIGGDKIVDTVVSGINRQGRINGKTIIEV